MKRLWNQIAALSAPMIFAILASCKPSYKGTMVPSAKAEPSEITCGDVVRTEVVKSYYRKLNAALTDRAANHAFNQFVAPQFGIVRDSKYVEFRLKEVGNVTPARIGLEDWKMISRRGMAALESVGYRGCLYDNGKVWFEAMNGQFQLISFNKDIEWLSPSEIADQAQRKSDPGSMEKQ